MSKKKTAKPLVEEQAIPESVSIEEATDTQEAKSVSIPKPAPAKKTGNLMYIGPTIQGTMKHSTVYKDGKLPTNAKKLVETFPPMERLLVPLQDIPKALKELNKEHSALRTIADLVAQKFIRR